MEGLERLFEIQKIIFEQIEHEPFFWRDQFNQLITNQHTCGILGARGIGKTTFLLRNALESGAKQGKALYVSADNIFFLENRLLNIVDYLYKQTDIRLLYIDEIHKYPTWKMELKNIIDTYPSFRIFFSGSSMIHLAQGKFDLSRRVILHTLCGLSFREYLEYELGKKIPKLTLEELVTSHLQISHDLNIPGILKHFNEYLKTGYYPFFKGYTLEKEKSQSLNNAVQMTIYEDIGTLHSLKTSSLFTIEQIFKYIINSSPGELNASKLSKALGKDFESVSTYIKYLEEAGLIRSIYPGTTGGSYLRNPIKMYPENTNLIHSAHLFLAQDQTKGKLRETFIVNQIQNAGLPIFASAKGDFKIEGYIFEIGGKNKSTKQIKGESESYIVADDTLIGSKKTIPLYLFGFLY